VNSTEQRGYVTIDELIGRLLLYGALLVAVAVVVVGACGPERVVLPRSSPSLGQLTVAPTTGAPTATRTATVAPTTAAPTTAAPSPTAPASPGSTPATACPERTGGATTNQAQLTAIRIAHNPGFDRLVFEFGPSTVPGGVYGMPPFRVAVATSLSGPSGQPVPIDGNALLGVRFQNASTVDPNGTRTYTGATSLKPTTTPLIKEVRLVEDFERVMVWGVGLQRLQCPTFLTLSGPVRLVLDFPTPP
jgi:hypothetical protein